MVGLGPRTVVISCTQNCVVDCARCYFENIVFSKGNKSLVCAGKEGAIHLNHCEISGGDTSCEDYPECNGGPGCVAASSGKPVCDRTGSQLSVKKCDVYRNHQAGLEAREGGKLVASENRIFDSGYHGVMIGPNAGECDIDGNKIFENTNEGILAQQNTTKIVIRNNDIHHNRPFGLSLALNTQLVISNNKIFENGFWGILVKTRTSAHIDRNVLSGNKCGGIYIGVNFSGRLHLESNIVRDHSGPWIDYKKSNISIPIDSQFLSSDFSPTAFFYVPPGEKNELYSNPPILVRNKEFNNKEDTYHPREVAQRLYSGCTYCHRSSDDVGHLMKCPLCHIASYCSKECQRKHRPKHETLCFALRSRYSLTVDTVSLLKGTGKGQTVFTSFPFKSYWKGP
ncbi:hypothetical protein OS493_021356 [Desmophyllum pertusum]|uniref:MYND-type domain-containing protein n=1 Tax=Desmophyllum pertusum TaxID=174260 RepID=A0A9W9ZC65_9CNID|nr:hypothetical protein OS493_021356 [Desmophyllum pertusum]